MPLGVGDDDVHAHQTGSGSKLRRLRGESDTDSHEYRAPTEGGAILATTPPSHRVGLCGFCAHCGPDIIPSLETLAMGTTRNRRYALAVAADPQADARGGVGHLTCAVRNRSFALHSGDEICSACR